MFKFQSGKRPNTSDSKQNKFARFSSPAKSQRSPLIRNGPQATAPGFLPPLLPPGQMNPYPVANFMPQRMGMEFQSVRLHKILVCSLFNMIHFHSSFQVHLIFKTRQTVIPCFVKFATLN